MKKIFSEPSLLEKNAKEKYCVPEFIMMEHAACFMKDFILKLAKNKNLTKPAVLIICGKGNNGGDGYALARLLFESANVTVHQVYEPSGPEAEKQAQMYRKLQIQINKQNDLETVIRNCDRTPDFIIDCIYGTGFHGTLSPEIKAILDKINQIPAIKIACDIPSALYFNADYTITMGELKTVLFSDRAKSVCGTILTSPLGLPTEQFESCMETNTFLIEKSDVKLPLRTQKAAHKGTYGHTAVIAGEKSGAGIIAATAALNFGSGLTTLVKTQQSNLEQFKITPELMLSDSIPQKTTCVLLGPGFDFKTDQSALINDFTQWFCNAKNPAAVLDAGIFDYENICPLLEKLNSISGSKIILTPHLSELNCLLQKIITTYQNEQLEQSELSDISIENLANNSEIKIKIGKILNNLFPNTVVVMKSANTFIAAENEIFVCTDGCQNLSKGGSGDVLAGMTASLLAQGYSAKQAAITACETHALASQAFGSDNYDLSPLKLINLIQILE